MSQKGEKYARRMERRVDKLEQDVAAITTEQTTQGVRISAVEDDLAVYRAAVSARELKQAAAEVKAAKERRTARAAERERKARRRNKVLAFIALALFVAVCVVMVAKAYSEEPAAEPAAPEASAAPAAILPTELLFTAAEEEYMEDPQETEKIEEALLAQGYFSLAVPMPYEWQDYMRTYCEEYGCPYHFPHGSGDHHGGVGECPKRRRRYQLQAYGQARQPLQAGRLPDERKPFHHGEVQRDRQAREAVQQNAEHGQAGNHIHRRACVQLEKGPESEKGRRAV